MSVICPCQSGKSFSACCGRYIDTSQFAKTPEQLMRSRYTAYALGGHGEYLLATWLPATAQGLTALELSERTVDWQGLKVVKKSQQGDSGEVEFHASFINHEGALEVMHEVSSFTRILGRWYYVGGVVS
jgi:SEC-C motif-containing protein